MISHFSERWLICNYDVECILTTLNDLYTVYETLNDLQYVEWFVLSWIICTYNDEWIAEWPEQFS